VLGNGGIQTMSLKVAKTPPLKMLDKLAMLDILMVKVAKMSKVSKISNEGHLAVLMIPDNRKRKVTMGLLNFPLGDHAKGAGSARLNAQNAGMPITNNPLPRRGLLSPPAINNDYPPTFLLPEQIQQLLRILGMLR
jgi:hypothetical protein